MLTLSYPSRYAYNIVPHPVEQKREGKFTLRIFSRKDICVEPVTETYTSVSHPSNASSHVTKIFAREQDIVWLRKSAPQ